MNTVTDGPCWPRHHWLHALFIYLIPEDVLSDFSTIFGVTGAL